VLTKTVMKSLFPVALSLGLACASSAAQPAVDLSTIKTNFHPQAPLTPTEVRTVATLAQRCGIRKVAKLETYNIHPSADFAIVVTSAETRHGREISYTTIDIARRENSKVKIPARAKSLGNFWAEPRNLRTNQVTVFTLTNQTVRIQVSDLPLATADKIFDALAKGKIRYSTAALAKATGRLNPLEVYAISGPGNGSPQQRAYSIRFTVGALTWLTISIRMEGEEVVVLDAMKTAA
jgi:hypothetical protein